MDEIDIPDFKLLISFDDGDEHASHVTVGVSKSWQESKGNYAIFTTEYDKTYYAEKLVRARHLKDLRTDLDEIILKQGINVPSLARKLKHLFATPQQDDWDYAQEEGYIDGRRLSQLIASPTEKRVFKNHRLQAHADCVLSFLVDCSGSMKTHSANVAILLDVFARAAEYAGIKTEILGFTTGNWSGGKPMREWIKQGKPKNPGRLNETCHIIYKDAEHSWKQSRNHVAALLKADLFREGVDGEAISWAAQRLSKRPEKKKILTVISDGSPMDSATNLANDVYYLDNHMKNVISGCEHNPELEIFGLGVQLDLSAYFRSYTVLHLEEKLNNATFNDILKLWNTRLKTV
jgi:cobaltochelatase CobT